MLTSTKEIFISYSRRDKPWVDSYLKCLLTAAQVEFMIDDEDFPPGRPIEESIIKAMERCPYTILVMTPHSVGGKWTHQESLLALKNLQQSADRQILPIKLRNCDVPPHIADRLYLDLCNPLQWDEGMAKLLKQIGVTDEGIAKALNSVAKKTLLLLVELMRDPAILEAIAKLRSQFVEVQRGNRQLETHKQLHDDMHHIQQTLMQLEYQVQDAAVSNWSAVFSVLSSLCVNLHKLITRAEAVIVEGVDVTFIRFFKPLPEEFDQAYQDRDARLLENLVRELARRLDQYLPRLNERILEYLQRRKLEAMAESLQTVYEIVVDRPHLEYDEKTTALLQEFRGGIDALVEIDMAIRERVQDHCILQDAEMDFQQIVRQGHHSLYEISVQWKRVGRWVSELKLTERYAKLLKSYDRLSNRLADETCIRDAAYEDEMQLRFQEFAHETRIAFNKLDVDLLALCNKLNPHNDELQQVLNRMQSDDWSDA